PRIRGLRHRPTPAIDPQSASGQLPGRADRIDNPAGSHSGCSNSQRSPPLRKVGRPLQGNANRNLEAPEAKRPPLRPPRLKHRNRSANPKTKRPPPLTPRRKRKVLSRRTILTRSHSLPKRNPGRPHQNNSSPKPKINDHMGSEEQIKTLIGVHPRSSASQ